MPHLNLIQLLSSYIAAVGPECEKEKTSAETEVQCALALITFINI